MTQCTVVAEEHGKNLTIKLQLVYFAKYHEIINLDPTVCIARACDILYQSYFTSVFVDKLA